MQGGSEEAARQGRNPDSRYNSVPVPTPELHLTLRVRCSKPAPSPLHKSPKSSLRRGTLGLLLLLTGAGRWDTARSWRKGTFSPGMRPAGNKNRAYQPLSRCFWLSAQGAFVFTQTQGQSPVTNNTISHCPEPGEGAGRSQWEGSAAREGQAPPRTSGQRYKMC